MKKSFLSFLAAFVFMVLSVTTAVACNYDFTSFINSCKGNAGFEPYVRSCLFPGQTEFRHRVGCAQSSIVNDPINDWDYYLCVATAQDIEIFKVCPGGQSTQPVLAQIKSELTFNSCGSVVRVDEQSVSEYIKLTGIPFSLVYTSEKVPGNRELYEIEVPVTHPNFQYHGSITSENVNLRIAGRTFAHSYSPAPNIKHQFI